MWPVRCDDVALILPRAIDAGEPIDLRVQQHVGSCLTCQAELARYHIARFLSRSHREGAPVAETQIRQYLRRAFKRNGLPSDKTFKRLLHEVGTCSDGSHWLPKNNCSQGLLF